MTLQNPDRVVIDIAGARIDGARALPEGQGFVKQLRVGPQGPATCASSSICASPAAPHSFSVAPPAAMAIAWWWISRPTSHPSAPPVVGRKSANDAHGRDMIVAIDAGHGGVDPGSIGKRGTREKNVTLAIARRLKERIDREPGMRAVLTRDNDHFVEHRERIARARRQQADMFVSVHADSYTQPIGRRLVGVRAVGARRERRIGALAGGPRELGGPRRRRLARRQGQRAGVGAARSFAGREHERQRRRRARRSWTSWTASATSPPRRQARRLPGAEVAGHSVDPGGDGLHLQSDRRSAAAGAPSISSAWPKRSTRACAPTSTPIRRRARWSRELRANSRATRRSIASTKPTAKARWQLAALKRIC